MSKASLEKVDSVLRKLATKFVPESAHRRISFLLKIGDHYEWECKKAGSRVNLRYYGNLDDPWFQQELTAGIRAAMELLNKDSSHPCIAIAHLARGEKNVEAS